jgi:hypothetical protein
MTYTSLRRLEGLTEPSSKGADAQHAGALADKYPDSTLQIGLYLVNALDDINVGKLDEQIDKLGDWIKKTDRPIYLRVGYEFDYPENKYQPDAYVKAFRRLRDKLDSREVKNVSYVWHSYAAANSKAAPSYYPGDAYVDWVAVSYFSPKQSFLEPMAQFAKQHGKPLMIAESCPRGTGTTQGKASWDAWFLPCMQYVVRNDVRAWSYINRDWESLPRWAGQGWGDSRLQANDVVTANWRKTVSTPRLVLAGKDLFKTLGK